MRSSHFAACILGVIAVLGVAGRVQAGSVSLNNVGAQQSVLEAQAIDSTGPVTDTESTDVNSLPFDNTGTPVRAEVNSSTVAASMRATLSSSDFNLAFGETLNDNGNATSTTDIFFTAGPNTTYDLTGKSSFGGTGSYVGELGVLLLDQSTSTTIYANDNVVSGPGMKVFPSLSGSSISGALMAGDDYEFKAFEMLSNDTDASANAGVDLSFGSSSVAAPLPSAGLAGLVLLTLVAGAKIGRRAVGA